MDDDIVDVIVPVYNNLDDARRLFERLTTARNQTRCRLVVIDDASSASVASIVPPAAGSVADVLFIRNATNRGFAHTVNAGIGLSRRDVILLNTDTLVFDGWLDRLRHASRTRPRVATVTPLSNAATILSYPTSPNEFKATLEVDWATFAGMCADVSPAPVPIPTGVGFCMLITRNSLDEIGLLDAEAFGIGYGEECDFCRRAASAGWVNLAAPDVFVWHRGEGSFAGRAAALRANAQQTLLRRHPDYASVIAEFIAHDPLLPARRALDVRRVVADPRPARLHLRVGPLGSPSLEFKDLFFLREGRIRPRYGPGLVGFASLANLPPFGVVASRNVAEMFLTTAKVERLIAYPRQGRATYLFWSFRRAARRLGLPVEQGAPSP